MAVMVMVVAVLNASAASAASTQARLLLGGVGGGFSLDELTARTGTVGQTLSYPVEVANVGDVEAQFRIVMGKNTTETDWGTRVQVLSGGGVDITALVMGADGYYTAPLPSGGAETLTVKVTLPSTMGTTSNGDSWGLGGTDVFLYSSDGTYIGYAGLFASLTPPKGVVATSSHDLLVTAKSSSSVTAGNQASVGSPWTGFISAPLVPASGGSQTFSATITNHSSLGVTDDVVLQPAFQYSPWGSCSPTVTASVKAGVLSTPGPSVQVGLKPGASATVTVTVKVSNWEGCEGLYFTLTPVDHYGDGSGPVSGNPVYLGVSNRDH